jgi:hypothetical protein
MRICSNYNLKIIFNARKRMLKSWIYLEKEKLDLLISSSKFYKFSLNLNPQILDVLHEAYLKKYFFFTFGCGGIFIFLLNNDF